MTREPGSKLGPYQVLAPLGAGGMGRVDPGAASNEIRIVQNRFEELKVRVPVN